MGWRMSMWLKIFLVMILLEVKLYWFIFYHIAFCLFALGYLNFIDKWWSERKRKVPSLGDQLITLQGLEMKHKMDTAKVKERQNKRKKHIEAGEAIPSHLAEE